MLHFSESGNVTTTSCNSWLLAWAPGKVDELLTELRHNGGPVYVMYQPSKAPVVLSETLSVIDVRGRCWGCRSSPVTLLTQLHR